MDQGLAGVGDAHQRVGLRRDLADARADREHQIGRSYPRHQRRGGAGAEIAGKARQKIVDDILTAERAAHRQIVRHREIGDVDASLIGPAAAADQHDRPRGAGEQALHFGEILGAGMGMYRPIRPDHRGGGALAQHVLRQGNDDRAGAARGRDLKRLVQQFGHALGHVDLRHPFGERRVHLAEIDFLKRLAVDLVARDLPDQHDHRGRILVRGMDADRGVARAGAAGHEQHAGLAGQLAVSLGHEGRAALLPAGHEADFGRVVERVEHFEIALAGDAERHLDAVRAQCRDDELAAAQFGQVGRHFLSPVASAPLLWAEAAVRRKRVVGAGLRQAGISAIAPWASRKMRSCGTARRSASSRFIPA